MGKIRAFVKLTRLEHSIMLVIAVIAAELITGGLPSIVKLVASIVTPTLVSMGSFAINDYFDVEADKANNFTKRPLVSGEISVRSAHYIAVALLVVGALASILINRYAFIIAVAFAALAYLYSYKMKDMLLVGNAYIAFSMVIPFIYGDFVSSNNLSMTIVLISFVVFLSGLAREVHGMIRDREGDAKARGSRNLVHYIDTVAASNFSLVLYLEAIAISIYMFFFSRPFAYNLVYMIPIAVTDIMLLYVAFGEVIIRRDKKKFFALARNISLAAMTLALFAYLAAAILFIPI